MDLRTCVGGSTGRVGAFLEIPESLAPEFLILRIADP
jgi:hypothetical protein